MGSAIHSKDELLVLHKCWIQEWGEIDAVTSEKKAAEVKRFLSKQQDTLRKPYASITEEFLRRQIIVGTVNNRQFLKDPTGDRRFWIIPVQVDQIDLDTLAKERDAIWSAAVAAYRAGERCWLTREEEQRNHSNNQNFQETDEWETPIAEYISGKNQVSISEVLTACFDFSFKEINKSQQMRVADILGRLGWKKAGQCQHQGKRQLVWRPDSC